MSGGALSDFAEWRNESTVEKLRSFAAENPHGYPPEVTRCLLEAADQLEESTRKVRVCDYLLAGDHSEESFLKIYTRRSSV